MEKLQIFVNIYFTIFPLCFTGISITIAFYPQVGPNIVNRIAEFEEKIEGNFFYIEKMCTVGIINLIKQMLQYFGIQFE